MNHHQGLCARTTDPAVFACTATCVISLQATDPAECAFTPDPTDCVCTLDSDDCVRLANTADCA